MEQDQVLVTSQLQQLQQTERNVWGGQEFDMAGNEEEDDKEEVLHDKRSLRTTTTDESNAAAVNVVFGEGKVADAIGASTTVASVVDLKIDGSALGSGSVYFDHLNGMWKCHHCTWTYFVGSPWVDHNPNVKGHKHVPMNVENFYQHGLFFMKPEGTKSIDAMPELTEAKHGDEEILVENLNFQKDSTNEIVHQHTEYSANGETKKHDVVSDFSNDEIKFVEDFDLVEEVEEEETKYDVETVVKKQNTHHLFCPNCHSCITKRVILRRRKPRIRRSHKPDKNREVLTPNHVVSPAPNEPTTDHQGNSAANVTSNESETQETDDRIRCKELGIFKCLSCFSIFIPTGNGFKLFPFFRDRTETENLQESQDRALEDKNWFSLFFNKDRVKIKQDVAEISGAKPGESQQVLPGQSTQETSQPEISRLGSENKSNLTPDAEQLPNQNGSSPILSQGNASQEYGSDTIVEEKPVGDKSVNATKIANKGSGISNHDTVNTDTLFDIGGSTGTNFQNKGHSLPSPISNKPGEITEIALSKTEIGEVFNGSWQPTANGQQGLNGHASSVDENLGYKGKPGNGVIPGMLSDLVSPNSATPFLDSLAGIDAVEKPLDTTQHNNTGNEVILDIEEGQPKPTTLPPVAETTIAPNRYIIKKRVGPGSQVVELEGPGVGIDILKSIVYGGLVESITSLGVVSSAAGGGASTLNIVVLALANLIGGLFIICHNLVDLKKETSTEADTQEDRYHATLGRRQNFKIHAPVAIISYLIFGLLPPVIYGFTFRTSDNTDYKLIAVGCASLVCIMLLATAKAHVRTQNNAYIRTILYYVVIGFMASGLSFAAGQLIKELLVKLGLFDSTSSFEVNMALLETVQDKHASIASY